MTYRFNKDVLVINEEAFFVRQYVQKIEINSVDVVVRNGGWSDRFSLPIGGYDDLKFKEKLKQDIEAWVNKEHESNH